MPTKSEIAVYVETGAKRVFASAVDWPGLSRGANDERAALQNPRYFVGRAAWHVLDHTWEIEDRVSG